MRQYSDFMYSQKFFDGYWPFVAAYCLVGGTTSLLSTTRGDDVECCLLIIAVHRRRNRGFLV
jgi:hypothetical protein